jgi:hypothetical protein
MAIGNLKAGSSIVLLLKLILIHRNPAGCRVPEQFFKGPQDKT